MRITAGWRGIWRRARQCNFGFVFLIIATWLMLSACGAGGSLFPSFEPSSRVLFIGNSFTDFNGGVDQALKGLDRSIATERLAPGGYTLEAHWNGGQALNRIRAQKWNYVALQNQSQTPVVAQAKFSEYAGKFANDIRAVGAEPILFMPWQRPDSLQYGVTAQALANSYFVTGNRYNIKVAAVGWAFARALQEKPGQMPTVQGTYLAACVIYASLLGRSPVGLRFTPSGMSAKERDFQQNVAAATTGF